MQENKITMVLITLIVIFLICHTPTAVYMLWKSSWDGRQTTSEKKIKNSMLGMVKFLWNIYLYIRCIIRSFLRNIFMTHIFISLTLAIAMRNILLSINSSCKILVYLIMYDDFWTSLTRCFCSCSANAPKEVIYLQTKQLS